jgi:hypothetical protein
MDLPNIPSENLYKFFGISGLVLSVFCLWFPNQKEMEGRIALADLQQKQELLEHKQTNATKHHMQIGADPNKLESERTELNTTQSEFTAAKQKTKAALDYISYLERLTTIGLPIGILLFLAGTFFWWHRVQRFDDLIKQNEARNSAPSPPLKSGPTCTA